jgi:hypothetical protein
MLWSIGLSAGARYPSSFRAVQFNVSDDGRTGLGNNGLRSGGLYVLKIAAHREFGPKTDVEYRFDPEGPQIAVDPQIVVGKTRCHRRSHDGNYWHAWDLVEEAIEVVHPSAGIMGTRVYAASAADAQFMVDVHRFTAPVNAIFYRAGGDALMAIDTVIGVDDDDGTHMHMRLLCFRSSCLIAEPSVSWTMHQLCDKTVFFQGVNAYFL